MRPPESLADDVIDRLFSALLVRYGSPFLDRWRDLELAAVKGDWARELAGFGSNLGALRFALDHLPERPPSVIEFRKLCNAAPLAFVALPNDAPVRGPNAAERAALKSLRRTFGIRPPDIDETPLSEAEVAIAQHDWLPEDAAETWQ